MLYSRKKYSERLLDGFGTLSDEILENALYTDNAEKLKMLKLDEKESRMENKGFFSFGLRMVSAFAAFAIVFGVVLGLYINENKKPDTVPWDITEEMGTVSITSIDELNYYTAKRVIMEEYSLAFGNGSVPSVISVDMPKVEKVFADVQALSNKGEPEDEKEDKVYYEMDPSWDYAVNKVTYFRIELKNPEGFLAKRLGGTGDAEVVIIESASIEPMITFKKGEHYYSCLLNSEQDGVMEFVTSKYIDGFRIVKETSGIYFSFFAKTAGKMITMLDCDFGYAFDPDVVWDTEADRISVYKDTTRILKVEASFKIWEIEAFFNTATDGIEGVPTDVSARRRGEE